MKIQRRFLRKYKDKNYYKYVMNIPPKILKEAGFDKYNNDIEDFTIKGEKGKIIIVKSKK